jgi:23S rRNA (cytosine1962-C5)-methyltransferase
MNYELLDFGDGRRLERFGTVILDRPCPAADRRRQQPNLWHTTDARFDAAWSRSIPNQVVAFGSIKLEIRCTPFGHVGVFPEQAANWQKLAGFGEDNLRVLNLFAYTGGSSIAAAKSSPNTKVVHVDSAKGIVAWAKHNAELNDVHSIRFIVEDVRKFVKRELKRGNRYDAVILDPPSYGHGVKGEAWQMNTDLPPLLTDIAAVLSRRPAFVLLTTHTCGWSAMALQTVLGNTGVTRKIDGKTETFDMQTTTAAGNALASGCGIWLTH